MKKSLIQIIKDFFSKIFNNQKVLEAPNNDVQESVGNIDNIPLKTETTTSNDTFEKYRNEGKILNLKNKFMNGEIEEEDMSEEEVEGVRELLNQQIEELTNKMNYLQKKLYDTLSKDVDFMELYKKYTNNEIDKDTLDNEERNRLELFNEALKSM